MADKQMDHRAKAQELLHQAGMFARGPDVGQVLATCAVAAALLSIDDKLARLVPPAPLDLRGKADS